ncbi:MAG: outer membrane beta-barrel protein, partial [Deltaproteobacteria bacterium]|nr:outer membrane beta-barrel protein [Nannocystaceae bacterium]
PPPAAVLEPDAAKAAMPSTTDTTVRGWVVGGFVDAGYVYNSNAPDNHVIRGNSTAPRSGEITVPLGVGYLRHDPTAREPWQLELALQVGSAAQALVEAEPRPGGDASRFAGADVWRHLGRANAGARIPRIRTEISAGLFNTPLGYWSFWSKDNWTYSTPWHLNAVPYVLMGARVLQPVGERVVLHAWVVNGWQSYADLNRVPSYMFGVVGLPVPELQLGHFEYFGPEDVDTSARAWRWLSDSWAVYERGRWGLAAVFDIMRERVTALPEAPVAWYVTGALVPRVRLLESARGRLRWLLSARGEVFWDRRGRIFGVDQLLGSAGANTDLQLFDYVIVRLEYRYDRSNAPGGFFYRGGAVADGDALARQQHAVYFSLTGTFEHWFAARARRR